jgi:hypothetical protein
MKNLFVVALKIEKEILLALLASFSLLWFSHSKRLEDEQWMEESVRKKWRERR